MKKEQLAERIGNIDDRLIQEAGQLQNRRKSNRNHISRKILAAAAVMALMVCSGTVGAAAFAKEIMVEVPVPQETITFEEIGITLILPDSWKGRYKVVEGAYGPQETPMWDVCVKSVYDAPVAADEIDYTGTLFSVIRYADYSMSAEEFAGEDIAGIGRYLLSTGDATYAILYTTDVQYDLADPLQAEEFNSLQQTVKEIQIVLDGRMEELTNQMVSMGIVKPGMEADDGRNLVWEGRKKVEIEGNVCYAFDLRFSDDETTNGEMAGRLIGSYAVSEDGMKFYWYNPADDVWEQIVG